MSIVTCNDCCKQIDTDFIDDNLINGKSYCDNCYEEKEQKITNNFDINSLEIKAEKLEMEKAELIEALEMHHKDCITAFDNYLFSNIGKKTATAIAKARGES